MMTPRTPRTSETTSPPLEPHGIEAARGPMAAVMALAVPAVLATFVLGALGAGKSRASEPPEARFALVIGYNQSDDPRLDTLRYADDDALRHHELLSTMSDKAIVLVSPDAETSALLSERLERIHTLPPTRANLLASLQNLRSAMQRARLGGQRPILIVVYSGHGNYDAEGRGYLHLADGRFTTRDLFQHVLEPTRDDTVILVIDACNAGLMVNGRGRPAEVTAARRPAGGSRLDLSHFPNVGVVLANSALGETHEWGRFLAGVFSHQVRSGLLGAADLDDDQRIDFAELAAFVASANARVKNPTVRITPYIRPPLTDPGLALVDLGQARLRGRLRVDRRAVGKAYVVDHDLVRYADFHRTPESPPFWLALTRPGELVLTTGDEAWIIAEDQRGELDLGALEKRPRTALLTRGPGSEYFERTLFHEPFDRPFAERYLSGTYLNDLELSRIVEAPWWDNPTAWAILGGGLAALGAGVATHVRAKDLEAKAFGTPWASRRAELNDEARTWATSSHLLYGVGGAAVVTSTLLFALDRPTRVESHTPPLTVDIEPSGVRLRATW